MKLFIAAIEDLPVPVQIMGFSIQTLVRFWDNHHLLDVMHRPIWRTVTDRTCQYVHKIVQGMQLTCNLGSCSLIWGVMLAYMYHT